MNLLPQHTEVLVSSLSGKEVIKRLDAVTRDINYQEVQDYSPQKIFNGRVNTDSFHLSLEMDSADSFLPLIHGKIESAQSGCILFLNYKLYPGAVFFLHFWIFVTALLGLFFLVVEQDPTYALLSFAVGIGNLAYGWAHFHRKLRKSQKIFRDMLSLQKKD